MGAIFTSGPWRADGLAVYAGDELIAHVGGTLGAGPRVKEQEANARLMAGSLDLLGVVKGFLFMLPQEVVSLRDPRYAAIENIRKIARETVAGIEGG